MHALDLYFVPERNAYCRLDRRGEIEDVIKIIRRKSAEVWRALDAVTILRKDLDKFMALSETSLVLKFDFTRVRYGNFHGWGEIDRYERNEPDLYYNGGKDGQGSFANGVIIVRPKVTVGELVQAWKDEEDPKKRRYAIFKIYDRKNNTNIETSCAPEFLSNYFQKSNLPWEISPAFFRATPYPHLLVLRPGAGDFHTLQSVEVRPSAFSTYYLVAPWKFGLKPEVIAPFDGKSVTLKGTLIYRGDQTMIEVVNDSIQATNTILVGKSRRDVPAREGGTVAPLDAARTAQRAIPTSQSLGWQTLVGEIVDSKCFLGVMNPGQLTPHRACAIRCISGGVPPVLLVRQRNGPAIYLLLVSADGKPVNQQVLDLVAEPVEITGEVERQGELLILRADPATYRRVRQ